MSDRPGVIERVSVALNSSDLSLTSDRRRDLDHVMALGAASRRIHSASGALMRLHLTRDESSLRQAMSAVESIAVRLANVRGWRVSPENLAAAAHAALAHHINPVCHHCHGRGYESIPGTPKLSSRACPVCSGTGRRPFQKKNRNQVIEILLALEQIDQVTERAVGRLLR